MSVETAAPTSSEHADPSKFARENLVFGFPNRDPVLSRHLPNQAVATNGSHTNWSAGSKAVPVMPSLSGAIEVWASFHSLKRARDVFMRA